MARLLDGGIDGPYNELDPYAEIKRLRTALEEIRDHWANQYDHPRKDAEMYRGPYGIGITDGHRACAIIAEKALQ